MDIAFASNGGAAGMTLGSVIPLLLIACILGFFFRSIAKRKGIGQILGFIGGIVPGFNAFFGLWLASLPERSLVDKIDSLTNRLQEIANRLGGIDDYPKQASPQTWKCNCGMILDMEVQNCPTCGLKRDYLLRSIIDKL
jgi:hypothetical protein